MKIMLQSCGMDSIGHALFLLGSGDMVLPVHINYGGKTNKEGKILRETLWPLINNRYPNYLKPVTLKMKKQNVYDRNLQMIELVRDHFRDRGYTMDAIYTGILSSDSRYPHDSDIKKLSEASGVKIIGPKFKDKEHLLGVIERIGDDMLELIIRSTSSCQVWFKKHCGQCFSCVRRFNAFHKIFGDNPILFRQQGLWEKCLVSSLMYGAGLRLTECLSVHVHVMDFVRNEILTRCRRIRKTG